MVKTTIILLAVNNAKLNEILAGDQNCLHHIKKIHFFGNVSQ
jgi:hypothetical protein